MIGTSFETMGGVATVVKGYKDAGLFERCLVVYLASHQDGSRFVKFARAIVCLCQLVVLLSRHSICIAHLHVASRSSFWRKSLYFTICRIFGAKTILHLHGGEFMKFYGEESGYIGRRCINYIFNHADHIIVLSPQWKQEVVAFTSNKNATVINNAVPVPAIRRKSESNSVPCVVFLGWLGKRKGFYDLLEAFHKVRRVIPCCKLECAGDGDLEPARAFVDALGLTESVAILGWISSEKREEMLQRATLFVLPSYAEGLPMSLLEAMAAGLPVVTTSVGGIPDVVTDGVEGIIVDPGDVSSLADAMTKILLDTKLRHRLGKCARQRITGEFDIDSAVKKIETLYREIVSP